MSNRATEQMILKGEPDTVSLYSTITGEIEWYPAIKFPKRKDPVVLVAKGAKKPRKYAYYTSAIDRATIMLAGIQKRLKAKLARASK